MTRPVFTARAALRPAGAPEHLDVQVDRPQIRADGRDVAQLEIILRNARGTKAGEGSSQKRSTEYNGY